MVPETLVCDKCNGDGYTSDHANHPHPDGDCLGECPIQVQCEHCYAKGYINGFDLMRHEINRRQNEVWKRNKESKELPF